MGGRRYYYETRPRVRLCKGAWPVAGGLYDRQQAILSRTQNKLLPKASEEDVHLRCVSGVSSADMSERSEQAEFVLAGRRRRL